MNFRSKSLSVLAMATLLTGTLYAQPVKTIRVAVIGGSVANAGFPARFGVRLPADSVISYAFSGGTVLKSGDSSYWTSGKLAQVFAYQPDIVVLHLGGNDSKPINWDDSANFEKDYKALIDTLATMPSQPRLIVAYPTPVWKDETAPQSPQLLRGSVIQNSIVPLVRKVAKDKGTDTVNLHAPLLARQTLFTDSINPTTAGNDTLGRKIFLGLVEQSTRVMCVGNSITQGAGNAGLTAKDAYPILLNKLLGKRYWVWNGGKSGWWMQRRQLPGASSAYKSYVTDKAQMDTLFMMKPHFITIKLGTNDARQNFWNTAGFITDYRYFIDTLYNNMTPKPKIVLLKAFPAWKVNGDWAFSNTGYTAAQNGINGDIIRDSLFPSIDIIANSRTTQVVRVIDLYTPFATPTQTLSTDGVHPNKAGQDTLAHFIYRNLLPIVTAINRAPRQSPKAKASTHRALRFTARPMAAPRGVRSLDGKAAGSRPAAGAYVKPAAKK